MPPKNNIKQIFQQRFTSQNSTLHHFFAAGRLNLIGEHIDYNGGLVLPMAIELGINAYLSPRIDGIINIQSLQSEGVLHIDLAKEKFDKRPIFWTNYPLGIIKHFFEASQNQLDSKVNDLSQKGFDLLIDSNLPMASGLSSSAALEVLTAFIWQWQMEDKRTFEDKDLINIALIAQKVENDFIGVQCGIMDQFAVAMGKKTQAIQLSCNTLAYEYCNFTLSADHTLLILNTNKKRTLADSKYNQRKQECDAALAILQATKPSLKHLCEATISDLKTLENHPILHQRAKHVITEQSRVLAAVAALQKNDLSTFGWLMNESHRSLRENYEVSGPELDFLVHTTQQSKGCLGARMTGAGFGGCAIAILKSADIESFKKAIKKQYDLKTGLSLTIYESKASRGVTYKGAI